MSRLRSFLMYAGLLGSLVGFACTGSSLAQTEPEPGTSAALRGPEQRVALVIGNAHYRNAPQLANPDNDASSMAQFLNKAGFEVISAIDLTQNDMIRVVQDFSSRVAARGPNAVAMVYYAGHGVQLAGENYLVPVDANIATPNDLTSNSLRLVDLMATLDSIPSRMRIVLLDACRNNPFPGVSEAGRGLAIVDAPNGSIVGYSTAPGTEALDGSGNHSPYAEAFLKLASEPNLPIEQLFKRVRLAVNNSTDGRQTPWESSSLTSDFYFFGDTAVAAMRAPNRGPVVQTASNLPSRSVQQAYDYVLSEGSPVYYQQFIEMYPRDPLSERIRWLLGNLLREQAWHKAVLANSPFAYKTFHDNFGASPYAQAALKLQAEPRAVPLMQATKLIVSPQLAPSLKQPINFGLPKDGIRIGESNGQVKTGGGLGIPLGDRPQGDKINIGNNGNTGIVGKIGNLPGASPKADGSFDKKIVTMPAPGGNTRPANGNTGIAGGNLPVNNGGRIVSGQDNKTGPDVKATMPANRVTNLPSTTRQRINNGPVLRLNNNPSMGSTRGTFQGNAQPGKVSYGGNNGGARLAMGGSPMRRGF